MTEESEMELYGDGSIKSADAKVPRWLIWVYILLPIWGVVWTVLYWNGAHGWIDKGYWFELEKAANTTYPSVNVNKLPDPEKEAEASAGQ